MGAIISFLRSVLTFASTAGVGWMASDYMNESARTEQLQAQTGQPQQEGFSLFGSILGKNWKKYLIWILIGGAILFIINLLLNRRK